MLNSLFTIHHTLDGLQSEKPTASDETQTTGKMQSNARKLLTLAKSISDEIANIFAQKSAFS